MPFIDYTKLHSLWFDDHPSMRHQQKENQNQKRVIRAGDDDLVSHKEMNMKAPALCGRLPAPRY